MEYSDKGCKMRMTVEEILEYLGKVLQNGVPKTDKTYIYVLSEVTWLAQHKPEILRDLRYRYLTRYLLLPIDKHHKLFPLVNTPKVKQRGTRGKRGKRCRKD